MRQHRVGEAALLGVAALLLAPAAGSAQVSINFGTPYARYGMSPGYFGGYNPGYYSYGYSPYSWGYSPWNSGGTYAPSYSWYGSGAYAPGYAWGGYNYPSYSGYSGYSSAPSYGYASPGDTGGYYSGTATRPEGTDRVLLNVVVPDADADVWVEGQRTRQRGTRREFISPPINPDKNYTYEVRARWMKDGREVEQTKNVPVRPNGTATVDFNSTGPTSRVDEILPDRGKRSGDTSRPEKP